MLTVTYNQNLLDNNPTLLEEQIALEADQMEVALARCEAKIERKGFDSLTTTKQLSKTYMSDLVALIDNWVSEAGKVKKKPKAWKFIEFTAPSALAYITEREVLRSIPQEFSMVTSVASAIGMTYRNMLDYERFAECNAEEAKKLQKRLKYAPSDHKALRLVRRAMNSVDFDCLDWEPEECIAIGLTLLDLFCEASGIVEFHNKKVKGKTEKHLVLTESGAAWYAEAKNREAVMEAFHWPMLICPDVWTDPYDGGYLDKKLHGLTLVRSRRRSVNRKLEAAEMPAVYSAINAIQSTPWRINKRVAEVFKTLYATKKAVAGLPSHTAKEIPEMPCPSNLDYTERGLWMQFNPEEAQKWKRKAAETHKENAKHASKLHGTTMKIHMIDKFQDREAIYYPHSLDFRGRIYPVAGVGAINPQGDDSGKALIEFAIGKPLGERGAYWLGVHLSNVWGDDKLELDDRYKLAVERSEEIQAYAADPIANTGWMEADKPFGFLAACFEWSDYLEQGESFVSHMPIAMDGSCSGLQHYAAILRDVGTAKAVNVIPSGNLPADVYMQVRDSVFDALENVEDPMAEEWRPRLKRDSVKQPVMTTVYGVTGNGMRDQIKAAVQKATDKQKILPFSVSASEAAQWLAPHVEDGIAEVIRAAKVGMDWLKEVAIVLAEDGYPLKWLAPTGFMVTQDCRESTTSRLSIHLNGRRIRLNVTKDGPKISKRKQGNGLPPNFIHTHDASHLTLTTYRAQDRGIDNFAMIHDSFGTHACDTDVMNKVNREQFCEMYDRNTFLEMRDYLATYVDEDTMRKIPPVPELGDLDLELVKSSPFFFA